MNVQFNLYLAICRMQQKSLPRTTPKIEIKSDRKKCPGECESRIFSSENRESQKDSQAHHRVKWPNTLWGNKLNAKKNRFVQILFTNKTHEEGKYDSNVQIFMRKVFSLAATFLWSLQMVSKHEISATNHTTQ